MNEIKERIFERWCRVVVEGLRTKKQRTCMHMHDVRFPLYEVLVSQEDP